MSGYCAQVMRLVIMKAKYLTLVGTALTIALSSNVAVAQSTKFPQLQQEKEAKSSPQDKELAPDVMEILCKNFPLNSRCPGGTAVKPVEGGTPDNSGTQVTPPPSEVPKPEGNITTPDSGVTPVTPPSGTGSPEKITPDPLPDTTKPEGNTSPTPDSGVTPMTPPSGTGSPEKITPDPLPDTTKPEGNTSPTPDSGVTPMTPPSGTGSPEKITPEPLPDTTKPEGNTSPTPDSGVTPIKPSGSSGGDTNKITPVPGTQTPGSLNPSGTGKPDGNVITIPGGQVKPNNDSQLNLPTPTTTPESTESEKKPGSSSDGLKQPDTTLPNSGSEVAPTGVMGK
jgi:hypothetical protein